MIGLSAVLLYATLGRIAGISGITFGLVWGEDSDKSWRWAFVAGLIAGGWLAVLAGVPIPYARLPASATGQGLIAAAGILVGFGTRLGNGCTSGHGVCGLARFSRRSLAAVAVFMAFGMLTATVLRPLWP